MAEDAFAGLPRHPPSVAEWEDLLVRLEIAPRALRVTLEDAPAGDAEVRGIVGRAADREALRQRMMEAMRTGEPLPAPGGEGAASPADADVLAAAGRFNSLRMRTFAMAQRRGVDVWAWESPDAAGRPVTVYQLFTRMARDDGELLAALRVRIRAPEGTAC